MKKGGYMNNYSVLNGSRMRQQSMAAIILLQNQNEELSNLKLSYQNINNSSEIQGETSTTMKQHMGIYCDLIDATIVANEMDIQDHSILYRILDDEFYDGALIKQEQNRLLREKAEDEQERNRCYTEYYSRYKDGDSSASLYYQRYSYYCGEVEADQREYDIWHNKEVRFDELNEATLSLFLGTGEIRKQINMVLEYLVDAISSGEYQLNGLQVEWKEELINLLKNQWSTFNSGDGEISSEKIFLALDDVGSMSNIEYQAFVAALNDIGVNISNYSQNDNIKEIVYNELLTKMYSNKYDLNGEYVKSPFDNLSYLERELFVYMYEERHEWDASQMNTLTSQFSDPQYIYDGWEEDMINIKFLAYSAPEPYKSLYIDNVDKATIGSLNEPFSYASGGKFYIDISEFSINDASSYSKIFHETTHCIDYGMGNVSATYIDKNGNKLVDVLKKDVELRINNEIDLWVANNPGLSDEDVDLIREVVIDSIMNEVDIKQYGKPDLTVILGTENKKVWVEADDCYDTVVKNIKSQVTGCVSDNYGGFTGNTLRSGKGHQAIRRENGKYRVYWVEGTIEADGSMLKITLDNGTSYLDPAQYQDLAEKARLGSNFDEYLIMSDGEMIYSDNIAMEFLAQEMEAYMTGDPDRIKAFDFYYEDTMDYAEIMIENIR